MTLANVSDPIDFQTFENSVHEWFSFSSDLLTVWRRASAPQPEYPFASLMTISGPTAAAPLWNLQEDYDVTRAAGKEIRTVASVPCLIVVSCQTYVDQRDSRIPQYAANSFMRKAQAGLTLPSVHAHFRSDGIAVTNYGPIQNIDQLIEDAWVSRANMDVTFGATLSVEEFDGYIASFELKSTSLGVDKVITLP